MLLTESLINKRSHRYDVKEVVERLSKHRPGVAMYLVVCGSYTAAEKKGGRVDGCLSKYIN